MRQARPSKIKRPIVTEDYFKTSKTLPDYKEPDILAKFLTERGKLVSRIKSGLSSKNQRLLSIAVKRARHLALLPFVRQV
jgi:ribosomal protein S18